MYGNVNVDYSPCKTQIQLDRASRYMLGELYEQREAGVIKTAPHLCWEMNCDRNIYSCDILTTRKLFGKRERKNANLAFKMSISFSPEDNDKLSYEEAFNIAKEFAEKFFTGYQVMFAVHTDTAHKHVHFLVGNCHVETGKAYRRSQKDLKDMCEFFGEQCMQRGLVNSVRKDYYNDNSERDKETFAERQMKFHGKETFKDELREVIQAEINDPNNQTIDDVVNSLMKHYHVECRVKGNTISYRHPNFTDKNGKPVSVRGSKLGDKYTVKGIKNELDLLRREWESERENQATENGIHNKRTAEKQLCTYNNSFVYITNTGTTGSGNSGADGNQELGKQSCTGNGGEFGGRKEQRENHAPDSIGNQYVPTLGELFSDYDRRNGKNGRKRTEKSESARDLPKRRKGIDR